MDLLKQLRTYLHTARMIEHKARDITNMYVTSYILKCLILFLEEILS